MNKVNVFVQKWHPYTIQWPSGHVICFSHFFQLWHPCYVTFFFCRVFMSFSGYYRGSGRHLHKGSPHSAKKNTKYVNAIDEGAECRMLTMKYGEHHYVAAITDVLVCFCCACLGGFQKEWLTTSGITLQPNTWQPDQKWLCLFWVMTGSFASAQTKPGEPLCSM